jgi:hypothetical protein
MLEKLLKIYQILLDMFDTVLVLEKSDEALEKI